jgi:hypothetical protein
MTPRLSTLRLEAIFPAASSDVERVSLETIIDYRPLALRNPSVANVSACKLPC